MVKKGEDDVGGDGVAPLEFSEAAAAAACVFFAISMRSWYMDDTIAFSLTSCIKQNRGMGGNVVRFIRIKQKKSHLMQNACDKATRC